MPPNVIDEKINELRNTIYEVAVKCFEQLEHDGLIYGNGHHAAQNITMYAERELLLRWKEPNKEKE